MPVQSPGCAGSGLDIVLIITGGRICVLVRLNVTEFATPATLAVTLYEPAVPLAVEVVEAAPLEKVAGFGTSVQLAPTSGLAITCSPASQESCQLASASAWPSHDRSFLSRT